MTALSRFLRTIAVAAVLLAAVPPCANAAADPAASLQPAASASAPADQSTAASATPAVAVTPASSQASDLEAKPQTHAHGGETRHAAPTPAAASPKPEIVQAASKPAAATTPSPATRSAPTSAALPALPPATSTAAALGDIVKQDYSPVVRTFVLLSLLSLLPVLLIGLTSFTRIIIVLSLLRHALGLPGTPPNSVLVTLAIFLTMFSMAPVIDQINANALQPYLQEKITASNALDIGVVPIRAFMVRQTRESDLTAVLDMAHAPRPKSMEDIKFSQLAPAFLLSELMTAFQIGFIIFLPFLLVDIVVAAILMALGMIMVPPSTISLPLKILLFILINGWVLVSRALLNSYWT